MRNVKLHKQTIPWRYGLIAFIWWFSVYLTYHFEAELELSRRKWIPHIRWDNNTCIAFQWRMPLCVFRNWYTDADSFALKKILMNIYVAAIWQMGVCYSINWLSTVGCQLLTDVFPTNWPLWLIIEHPLIRSSNFHYHVSFRSIQILNYCFE